MNLLEFLISTSFVVSFGLLISCVWKQIQQKSKSKVDNKYNNIKSECVDTNHSTIIISEDKTNALDNNSHTKQDYQIHNTSEEPNGGKHIPTHSEDSLTSVIRCERLEHINKTRPKRSNIRRSTRKSKIDFNSTLLTQTYCKNSEDIDFKTDFEEEISQRMSMFSLRIEEVTQPLQPLQPLQPHPNHHKIQGVQQNHQDNKNNLIKLSQTTIGRPFLNSEIIAELKNKQIESSID